MEALFYSLNFHIKGSKVISDKTRWKKGYVSNHDVPLLLEHFFFPFRPPFLQTFILLISMQSINFRLFNPNKLIRWWLDSVGNSWGMKRGKPLNAHPFGKWFLLTFDFFFFRIRQLWQPSQCSNSNSGDEWISGEFSFPILKSFSLHRWIIWQTKWIWFSADWNEAP
jgi:hypothetical protein